MANIDKELNQIKNAVYGREVRGSIHDGIDKINKETEIATGKADEAHDVMESIINDGFDNAALESNFEQKLDDKINNLQPEWTQFKEQTNQQLAQTENKLDVKDWELNSKARAKKGITVFTSDDGRIEEYTIAKDIFESEGVPQSIAVVPAWIGNDGFCTIEQILELQDLGWEIMSHSRTHPRNPVMKDNPDDAFVEREFSESKKILTEYGFNINNYVYPGGNYGKRERMFAKEYYRSARNSDGGFFSGVNMTPLNSHELKTIWLDPSSQPMKGWIEEDGLTLAISKMRDLCMQTIDLAKETNSLGIISTHFQFIDTPELQNLYTEVVQYAKTNTEVTTLNNALNKMGNIVEIGDYSEQGARATGDNHYVVGADGLISGSLGFAEEDRFSADTPFTHFPFGAIACPIRLKVNGLPGPGTLINFKPYPHEPGSDKVKYGWQEFVSYDNRLPKLRRDATGNSTYNEWYPDSVISMPSYNNFNLTTEYKDFPIGEHSFRVLNDDPYLHLAPEGRQGLATMVKQESYSTLSRYSYMEYQLWGADRVYRKRVIGENEFGEWFLMNGVVLSDENDFDTTTPPLEFPPGIIYSIITNSNPNIGDTPEGPGRLKTEKPLQEGFSAYTTEEFIPINSKNKYHRMAISGSEWGPWYVTEATLV